MRYSKLKTVLYVYINDLSIEQRSLFEKELKSRKVKFNLQLSKSRYSVPIQHEQLIKFLSLYIEGTTAKLLQFFPSSIKTGQQLNVKPINYQNYGKQPDRQDFCHTWSNYARTLCSFVGQSNLRPVFRRPCNKPTSTQLPNRATLSVVRRLRLQRLQRSCHRTGTATSGTGRAQKRRTNAENIYVTSQTDA